MNQNPITINDWYVTKNTTAALNPIDPSNPSPLKALFGEITIDGDTIEVLTAPLTGNFNNETIETTASRYTLGTVKASYAEQYPQAKTDLLASLSTIDL